MSTAALLPLSIVIASAANFVIVLIAAHYLPAGGFSQFSALIATTQLVNVLLFDWLRTYLIRHSDPSGSDSFVGIAYVALFATLIVIAVGLYVLTGREAFSFACLAIVGQGCFDFAQAHARVRFADVTFVVVAFVRAIVTLAAMPLLLAFEPSAALGLLAIAIGFLAGGVPSVLAYLARLNLRGGLPDRHAILRLLIFGYSVSFGNLAFYGTQFSIRAICLVLFPASAVSGVMLALDISQRIFMSAGMALNLIFLQRAIREIRSHPAASVVPVWIRQFTLVVVLFAPLALAYYLGQPLLAELTVPSGLQADFLTFAGLITIGSALFAVRTYGLDNFFVLHGKGYGAAFGGTVGLATASAVLPAAAALGLGQSAIGWSVSLGGLASIVVSMVAIRNVQRFRLPLRSLAVVAIACLPLLAAGIVGQMVGGWTIAPALIIGLALYAATLLAFNMLGFRTFLTAHRRARRRG